MSGYLVMSMIPLIHAIDSRQKEDFENGKT